MAHAEGNTTINLPAEVVFEFVLDGMNNPLWRPAVIDVEPVPGKPPGVGAAYERRSSFK